MGLAARALTGIGAAASTCGGGRVGYPPRALNLSKESRVLRRVSFEKELRESWTALLSHRPKDNSLGSCDGKRAIQCQAFAEDHNVSDDASLTAHARELLVEDDNQSFFERLARAWNILFPTKRKPSSNAEIAKQRLKMILISDRCSVNDEAKRRIVNNIVGALSDFVEIESEDKVQLTVSSDPDLGTVYSVTVPVRRVKPEYQEYSRELQNVALAEEFRTLDVKLEFPDALDS